MHWLKGQVIEKYIVIRAVDLIIISSFWDKNKAHLRVYLWITFCTDVWSRSKLRTSWRPISMQLTFSIVLKASNSIWWVGGNGRVGSGSSDGTSATGRSGRRWAKRSKAGRFVLSGLTGTGAAVPTWAIRCARREAPGWLFGEPWALAERDFKGDKDLLGLDPAPFAKRSVRSDFTGDKGRDVLGDLLLSGLTCDTRRSSKAEAPGRSSSDVLSFSRPGESWHVDGKSPSAGAVLKKAKKTSIVSKYKWQINSLIPRFLETEVEAVKK